MSVPDSYTARRSAFAQAIEACEELIRDYEKHRDHDGNVTGPDFNALEIEAVKTAIVRIQCIEVRETPLPGPNAWAQEYHLKTSALYAERDKLVEAMREIALMGMTAPREMGEPGAEWYKSRAYYAISIAAHALNPAPCATSGD